MKRPRFNVCNIYFTGERYESENGRRRVDVALTPAAFTRCNAARLFDSSGTRASKFREERAKRPFSAFPTRSRTTQPASRCRKSTVLVSKACGTDDAIVAPTPGGEMGKGQIDIDLALPAKLNSPTSSILASPRSLIRAEQNSRNSPEVATRGAGTVLHCGPTKQHQMSFSRSHERTAINGLPHPEPSRQSNSKRFVTVSTYASLIEELQASASLSVLNLSLDARKPYAKPQRFPSREPMNAARVYKRHLRLASAIQPQPTAQFVQLTSVLAGRPLTANPRGKFGNVTNISWTNKRLLQQVGTLTNGRCRVGTRSVPKGRAKRGETSSGWGRLGNCSLLGGCSSNSRSLC